MRARRPLGRLIRWLLLALLFLYTLAGAGLFALRWVNPPFTAVHLERRVESWFRKPTYRKRYQFVPLGRISRHLQHAVITSEDARFFEHRGFDWKEIREAVEDDLEDGRVRGASTITQQLVKNLFLTTNRSVIRKGIEFTLVPLAEGILSKRRILELYLNVIEWGPGVYGADAAARHHYSVGADRITREQGARLAAILPSPRRRKPARMDKASVRILERMAQAGW
jgi:monofunctional glycosyltransferase